MLLLYSAISSLSPDSVLYVTQGLFRRFIARVFQLHPDCLVHSVFEDIVRDWIREMVAKVRRLWFQKLNGTLEKLSHVGVKQARIVHYRPEH